MASTVEVPEDLIDEAKRLTGLSSANAVVNLAVRELVQGIRQHARADRRPSLDER